MKSFVALVVVACSVAAPAVSSSAETATPGKALYRQNCARCHGFQMVNPAPGVLDLRTFPRADKPRFIAAVSDGKGAMPSWKAMLSPEQIEMLWVYVSGATAQ